MTLTGTFEGHRRARPTEFIVVGFAGNRFTGDIAPALAELVEDGLIRLIDLAVVSKDSDGTVTILEVQELSTEVAAAFVKLDGRVRGLLSEADLDEIAEDLPLASTAAATPSSPSRRPASSPEPRGQALNPSVFPENIPGTCSTRLILRRPTPSPWRPRSPSPAPGPTR